MRACHFCGRWIWPWQSRGHYVRADGSLLRWHASHLYDAVPGWRDEPDQVIGFLTRRGLHR